MAAMEKSEFRIGVSEFKKLNPSGCFVRINQSGQLRILIRG